MNALGAWILGILGVVVIGAVIDLVLPSGRMNKYVKSVFAAVTVLVIVLPLPNFLKNGCATENFLYNESVDLQEGYLQYAESVKKNALIRGLKAALSQDGITLGDVELRGDFSSASPRIEQVKINFSQVVMVGQSAHINKYELIRDKVSQYLAVDKDVIGLYEQ